jgi:predicted nucleic acid-binding protein
MNGSAAFLVDTNVLVYAYDAQAGSKRERAIALLDTLAARQIGALTPQILSEFFVVVTQKLSPPLTAAEAERSLTNYARSWIIYDLTSLIVLEAVRGYQRHRLAYWDSLVWAAAKVQCVPNVLSEDFSNGSLLEGVKFINPFSSRFDMATLNV